MKNTFYKLVQALIICGMVVLLIPILLSAIPFIIYLLIFIQLFNYINKELKENNVKVIKGGNGSGNITLH